MSGLDITPGAVCEGVKVEDIIAPMLFESNLDKKGGRRPVYRPKCPNCHRKKRYFSKQCGWRSTARKGEGAQRLPCVKGGDPRTPWSVLSRSQVAGRRDATQSRNLHGYFYARLCWTRWPRAGHGWLPASGGHLSRVPARPPVSGACLPRVRAGHEWRPGLGRLARAARVCCAAPPVCGVRVRGACVGGCVVCGVWWCVWCVCVRCVRCVVCVRGALCVVGVWCARVVCAPVLGAHLPRAPAGLRCLPAFGAWAPRLPRVLPCLRCLRARLGRPPASLPACLERLPALPWVPVWLEQRSAVREFCDVQIFCASGWCCGEAVLSHDKFRTPCNLS